MKVSLPKYPDQYPLMITIYISIAPYTWYRVIEVRWYARTTGYRGKTTTRRNVCDGQWMNGTDGDVVNEGKTKTWRVWRPENIPGASVFKVPLSIFWFTSIPPPPPRSIISIGTFVRTCEWVGGVSRSRRGVGRAVLLRPRILRYTADWMTYLWSLTRDNDTVYKNARVCVHGNLHAETATGRRRITPYAYGDFVGGRRQQYRLLPRGVAARQGVVDRADYVEYLKVWAFVRSLGKRVSKTYGNISNSNNNNDNDKCVTIIHCNIHSRRPSHQG